MYIYTYIDCKYVVLFTCKYILHACKQYYSSKPLVYSDYLPRSTHFSPRYASCLCLRQRILRTKKVNCLPLMAAIWHTSIIVISMHIYIYHISINNIYVHTYIHIYICIYISITNTHIYIYISIILYSWYVIVVISCVYLMIIKWSTIFQ